MPEPDDPRINLFWYFSTLFCFIRIWSCYQCVFKLKVWIEMSSPVHLSVLLEPMHNNALYIHLMSTLITIFTWISMVYGISSVHHLQFWWVWVWFYPWKLSLAGSYILHLIPGECDHMQKAFNHIGCCCNFRWIIDNYGSFLLVQFILYTVSLPSLITF